MKQTRRWYLRRIAAVNTAGMVGLTGCQGNGNRTDTPVRGEDTGTPSQKAGTETPRPADGNESSASDASIRFEVTVPENTPEGDVINLMYAIPDPSGDYPFVSVQESMERQDEHTHTVTLEIDEIDVWGEERFGYIYNRNGWKHATTEYLPLQPEDREPGNPFEYRNAQREVTFEPGKQVKDRVERWRWFPEGDLEDAKEDVSHLGPDVDEVWPERIDGVEFRSGQVVQDLYIDGFDDFFDSTAGHMKEKGYRWVGIAPPWQWITDEPLPKIGNALELGLMDVPNYPNDEKLIEHIRAFKREGLNVLVAPQDCCVPIDTSSRDREWMEAYYDELERFLVHHAVIAERTEADAFYFAVSGVDTSGTEESWVRELEEQRWVEIWRTVKREFSGPVGQGVWTFEGGDESRIIPSAQDIPWGNELDFFYLINDATISEKDNPTDKELVEGAGAALDGAKDLYEVYGKPVWVRTGYFSVKGSWRAGHLEAEGIPGASNSEEYGQGYAFSGLDQARTINAYLEAIKDRPWIIGYHQFGYWHWLMPKLPDWDIRGKEAEDVWERWNETIYDGK